MSRDLSTSELFRLNMGFALGLLLVPGAFTGMADLITRFTKECTILSLHSGVAGPLFLLSSLATYVWALAQASQVWALRRDGRIVPTLYLAQPAILVVLFGVAWFVGGRAPGGEYVCR